MSPTETEQKEMHLPSPCSSAPLGCSARPAPRRAATAAPPPTPPRPLPYSSAPSSAPPPPRPLPCTSAPRRIHMASSRWPEAEAARGGLHAVARGGGSEGRPPRGGPRRRRPPQRSRGETTGDSHSAVEEAIRGRQPFGGGGGHRGGAGAPSSPRASDLTWPAPRPAATMRGHFCSSSCSTRPAPRPAAAMCCSRAPLPFAFKERGSASLHLLFPRKAVCLSFCTSCWGRNQEGTVPRLDSV
jgi:hypothetical protein